MSQPDKQVLHNATSSLQRHVYTGLAVLFLFFGAGIFWAIFTEISGAIVSSGRLSVENEIRRVQHPNGGLVKQLYVKEGDFVEKGQMLIALDDTDARAKFQINRKQLIEAQILLQRLQAELQGHSDFDLPSEMALIEDDPVVAEVLELQKRLLEVRLKSMAGQLSQIKEQIKQLRNQIEGLTANRQSIQQRIAYASDELSSLQGLLSKNLALKTRVVEKQSELAQMKGQTGVLDADMSVLRSSISELEIQHIQLNDTFVSETLDQIQKTQAKIAELTEIDSSTRRVLSAIFIEAPHSGYVHQMDVRAAGEVIAPGEDIMLIVPLVNNLIVETNVKPVDIDQLYVGQSVRLKLSALDVNKIPDINAKVFFISNELIEDPVSRTQNYEVKAGILDGELDKLDGQKLIPGMPAEVFIQTNTRTVLSYLAKPLKDQIERAFKQ